MKKGILAALSLTLLLSACAPGTTSSSQSSESLPSSSSSQSSSSQSSSDTSKEGTETRSKLYVADTSMYRGTVSALTANGASTTLTVTQADGRDYGAASIEFTFGENTKFYPDSSIKNGDYIEIFHSGAKDGKSTAIAVNKITDVAMSSIYNGVVVEHNAENKYILMNNLSGENQVQFNYDDNTSFLMSMDDVKTGAKLNVFHSEATTRSIPPQSFAYEVAPYKAAK